MAPQTPQPSERPGEARVAPLDRASLSGGPEMARKPPSLRSVPAKPGRSCKLRVSLALAGLQVEARENGATLRDLVDGLVGQVEHGPRRHEHHHEVAGGCGVV